MCSLIEIVWIFCPGFPIPNDPIYAGSVWGPKRGKGGDFGKSEEQVAVVCERARSIM